MSDGAVNRDFFFKKSKRGIELNRIESNVWFFWGIQSILVCLYVLLLLLFFLFMLSSSPPFESAGFSLARPTAVAWPLLGVAV